MKRVQPLQFEYVNTVLSSIRPVVLQFLANGEKIENCCHNSFFLLGNIVRDSVPEVPLVGFGLIWLIVEGGVQHSDATEKVEQDQCFYNT